MTKKWTNLSNRASDGTSVSLDFYRDPVTQEVDIRVTVNSQRTGEDFTLYPTPSEALSCFYHPFAHAARAISSGRLSPVS